MGTDSQIVHTSHVHALLRSIRHYKQCKHLPGPVVAVSMPVAAGNDQMPMYPAYYAAS